MDLCVLIENPADLFDRLKGGLSRVAGVHGQCGFEAADMCALVPDDSVAALPDRSHLYWHQYHACKQALDSAVARVLTTSGQFAVR